jgi:hypothetical protein
MSGSGSEALLRSFKESQRKNLERKEKIKKEEKEKVDDSPASSTGMELDHIIIQRDLKPSNTEILAAQERVGGSSMPPEDPPLQEEQEQVQEHVQVEIKAEDIRAEMSTRVKKAGKRRSTANNVNVGGEGGGEVMTRAKKARLCKAAAAAEVEQEVKVESMAESETMCIDNGAGSFMNGLGDESKPRPRVSVDGPSDTLIWRDERFAQRYPHAESSLDGPLHAGPSTAGPSTIRSALDGPSTIDSAAVNAELEKEVMEGIYANINMNRNMNVDNDNHNVPESFHEEDTGKGKGKAKAKGRVSTKGKGKEKEVVPAGEVRSGRWRKK